VSGYNSFLPFFFVSRSLFLLFFVYFSLSSFPAPLYRKCRRVYENRVLKRIFGPKGDEMAGESCVRGFIIFYSS
jgi:hypothetical protein